MASTPVPMEHTGGLGSHHRGELVSLQCSTGVPIIQLTAQGDGPQLPRGPLGGAMVRSSGPGPAASSAGPVHLPTSAALFLTRSAPRHVSASARTDYCGSSTPGCVSVDTPLGRPSQPLAHLSSRPPSGNGPPRPGRTDPALRESLPGRAGLLHGAWPRAQRGRPALVPILHMPQALGRLWPFRPFLPFSPNRELVRATQVPIPV